MFVLEPSQTAADLILNHNQNRNQNQNQLGSVSGPASQHQDNNQIYSKLHRSGLKEIKEMLNKPPTWIEPEMKPSRD